MSARAFLLALLLSPLLALAQVQTPPSATASFNGPTLAVLLANRPAHIEQAQWLAMMEKPVNSSLYPLRLTQATLDTLNGSALDRRFNYIMGR